MILKYLFSLCCSFELRDTRVLQGNTGKVCHCCRGKKVPSSKCKFALEFSEFFTVLPLISGLANPYGYREKINQTITQVLTAVKLRKQQTQKAPALLLDPPWALEEKCFFLRSFHLPEQPTVVKGNKVETVVEYKSPQKRLQQYQPFGKPSATQALWKACRGKLKPAAATSSYQCSSMLPSALFT